MKVCRKCHIEKPYSELVKDKSRPDGYAFYCKECWCVKRKQWQLKNPLKEKIINKRYKNKLPPAVYMVQNNLEPDKFYIGSSKTPQSRKTQHFSKHSNPLSDNTSPALQADMNRLGRENFSFHILHKCPKNELLYWETFYRVICQPYYNIY